jgi:hypothetical protein
MRAPWATLLLVAVCGAGCGHQLASLAAEEAGSNGVFLRVNQAGYSTLGRKSAIAFGTAPIRGQFEVVETAGAQVVFRAKVNPITSPPWGRFRFHAELDFTGLRAPGRYQLRLEGTVSPGFPVADNVLATLPDQLLEFMRQQRCGDNPWLNAKCHQADGQTAYGPMPAGTPIEARGGWHDAADLLKYLLTSGNATAQMLLAYTLAPGCLKDQVNDLGRPGANGLPDVLDEAKWGLDWLLKLHPQPDQLFHQVADDRDHYGWRLPQDDQADYGWGRGGPRVVYFANGQPQGLQAYQSESTGLANLAGRYAAAMGLACQIWKDHPQLRAFAQRCLQAGREVYALGRRHEGVQQGNSFRAPYRYAETTWADDMEWGAAELYRATGDAAYLKDALGYARQAATVSWMGREQTGHYEFYPFINVGHFALHDQVELPLRRTLAGYYRRGIQRCIRAARSNPYRIGVPFIWCSNNLVVALVTQCQLYERMTGDTRYRAFQAAHLDWLLGRNPWGYTMFTGLPAEATHPKRPHLMTTRLTGRPVCGGLVDGPVHERIFKTLRGVSITEPDPLALFQAPMAVYHDDLMDYSTNEPAMDGAASAILMFALLSAENKAK